MEKKLNEIFGLGENFTEEELDQRYKELYEKYSEDRFLIGEEGNIAARKLTEINVAYQTYKQNRYSSGFSKVCFDDVDLAIRDGDLNKAQNLLDEFDERNGEWHYLQAVIYYKKNWHNECKKQLEIAMQLDKNNEKYKSTYTKLVNKISADKNNAQQNQEKQRTPKGTLNWNSSSQGDAPQMGGNDCMGMCCDFLACNILLNCLCNGCCY